MDAGKEIERIESTITEGRSHLESIWRVLDFSLCCSRTGSSCEMYRQIEENSHRDMHQDDVTSAPVNNEVSLTDLVPFVPNKSST